MNFWQVLLLIIIVIFIIGFILRSIITITAYVSIIFELKKYKGIKESFKYLFFLLFQGLLALIGAFIIGYIIYLIS